MSSAGYHWCDVTGHKATLYGRENQREDRYDDGMWRHDRFNEEEQKPKSAEEIMSTHGFDIRKLDACPRRTALRERDEDFTPPCTSRQPIIDPEHWNVEVPVIQQQFVHTENWEDELIPVYTAASQSVIGVENWEDDLIPVSTIRPQPITNAEVETTRSNKDVVPSTEQSKINRIVNTEEADVPSTASRESNADEWWCMRCKGGLSWAEEVDKQDAENEAINASQDEVDPWMVRHI